MLLHFHRAFLSSSFDRIVWSLLSVTIDLFIQYVIDFLDFPVCCCFFPDGSLNIVLLTLGLLAAQNSKNTSMVSLKLSVDCILVSLLLCIVCGSMISGCRSDIRHISLVLQSLNMNIRPVFSFGLEFSVGYQTRAVFFTRSVGRWHACYYSCSW